MTPDNSRDYPRCIVHSSTARCANANMQLPTLAKNQARTQARAQARATARALPYLKDQTTSTNLCKLLVGACITLFMLLSLNKPAVGATKMPFEEESAELEQQLVEAYKAMGGSYTPRTEHLNPDGSAKFVNRLIREDSPYLIQHAHNPVNWYSWGEEAMDIAFAEDKPIFMSIGYATCHWCHVMERESFENEEIAEFLNSNFISIKVDREQRPDVDSTYMTAVQMMTGGGGWPLSSFLNIKATPFYGGTYYPPEAFLDLLKQIDRVWRDQRDELENQAQKVAVALVDANTLKSTARDIGERDIALAVKQLLTGYDDLQGGFGAAPKFPREPALYLLLEQAQRHQDLEALQAAHFTLERIAAGGIHDQIAGGFHRYATDNDWLIPHFEKMLYNQAALTRNYVQSWKLTGDQEHARIARRVLDYVLREMTSETGVFYSATDADSAGGEGEFFIWTPAEISEVLSKEDAELAAQVWGITEAGNFEQANILHMDGPIRDIADTLAMDIEELTKRLDSMSKALLLHRQGREAPLRDEKILTSWNAMMITAFAEASEALEEEKYLTAATTAMEQLLQINGREGDLLWRTHFDGTSSVDAGQADYANIAEALITLTDITGDERWLTKARALVSSMDAQFWDKENGAYFMGSVNSGGAALPVRPKERYDNATPGGNSVALRVLARLAARTGEESYRERAYELLSAFADSLNQSPSAFGYLLTAVNELEYGESGHRRFAGRGKVAVKAYLSDKTAVEPVVQVHIDIADGWHINANKPLQEYLIGTTFSDAAGETLNDVAYPQAKLATLGFERSELALYEGRLSIEIPLSQLGIDLDDAPIKISEAANGADMRVAQLALNLQACSDEVCLAPETLKLNVSLANHTL